MLLLAERRRCGESMGLGGLRRDPVTVSEDNDLCSAAAGSAAESGALVPNATLVDLDLVELIEAWCVLPPEVRVAVTALLRSIGSSTDDRGACDVS